MLSFYIGFLCGVFFTFLLVIGSLLLLLEYLTRRPELESGGRTASIYTTGKRMIKGLNSGGNALPPSYQNSSKKSNAGSASKRNSVSNSGLVGDPAVAAASNLSSNSDMSATESENQMINRRMRTAFSTDSVSLGSGNSNQIRLSNGTMNLDPLSPSNANNNNNASSIASASANMNDSSSTTTLKESWVKISFDLNPEVISAENAAFSSGEDWYASLNPLSMLQLYNNVSVNTSLYSSAAAAVSSSSSANANNNPTLNNAGTTSSAGASNANQLLNSSIMSSGSGSQSTIQRLNARALNPANLSARDRKSYKYLVLKHKFLFIYDGDDKRDCLGAIFLEDVKTVIIDDDDEEAGHRRGKNSRGAGKKERKGDLPASRFSYDRPIKLYSDEGAILAHSKCCFLFFGSATEKEDWFYLLLRHNRNRPHYPNLLPNAANNSSSNTPIPNLISPESNAQIHSFMKNLKQRIVRNPLIDEKSQWYNALAGRIFLNVYRSKGFKQHFLKKFNQKLAHKQYGRKPLATASGATPQQGNATSNGAIPAAGSSASASSGDSKRPSFLSDIKIIEMDLGDSLPIFSNGSLLSLDPDGTLTFSMDVLFIGAAKVAIETTATIQIPKMKPLSIPLQLELTLNKLTAKSLFKIKAPPTDRLWMGFYEAPQLDLQVKPIVSTRSLQFNLITNFIERKLRETIMESMVLPHMDDFVIPSFEMIAGEEEYRNVKENEDDEVVGEQGAEEELPEVELHQAESRLEENSIISETTSELLEETPNSKRRDSSITINNASNVNPTPSNNSNAESSSHNQSKQSATTKKVFGGGTMHKMKHTKSMEKILSSTTGSSALALLNSFRNTFSSSGNNNNNNNSNSGGTVLTTNVNANINTTSPLSVSPLSISSPISIQGHSSSKAAAAPSSSSTSSSPISVTPAPAPAVSPFYDPNFNLLNNSNVTLARPAPALPKRPSNLELTAAGLLNNEEEKVQGNGAKNGEYVESDGDETFEELPMKTK